MALAHGGLRVVRTKPRISSPGKCCPPCSQRLAVVFFAAKNYRRSVAQFFRCCPLRLPSAKCGDGRLGGGKKESALHSLLLTYDCCLWLVCSASRLEEVFSHHCCLCPGPDVQAHGGEPPACLTASRLLASRTVRGPPLSTSVGTSVDRETAAVVNERSEFRDNNGRATFRRYCGRDICTATFRAPGKRTGVLCRIHWEDVLARQSGRLLPPSGALLTLVRSRRVDGYPARDHYGGAVLPPRSLPCDGLVSLSYNAGSGNRNCPGWPPSHGRPLRVRSLHRTFCDHRLGRKRSNRCDRDPSGRTPSGGTMPDLGTCGCHDAIPAVLAKWCEAVHARPQRCGADLRNRRGPCRRIIFRRPD